MRMYTYVCIVMIFYIIICKKVRYLYCMFLQILLLLVDFFFDLIRSTNSIIKTEKNVLY